MAEAKDDKFTFVFLHGIASTGKLTTASELMPLLGDAFKLHHNHLLVDTLLSLFPFGSTGFVELRESMWLQIFDRAIKDHKKNALKGVVFTFCFEKSADAFPPKLFALLRSLDVRLHIVELTCDVDVVLQRIPSKPRVETKKLVDASLAKQLIEHGVIYSGGKTGAVKNDFEIDTTHSTPAESAKKIFDFIQSARVKS